MILSFRITSGLPRNTVSWAVIGNMFLSAGVANDFQITTHKEQEIKFTGTHITEIYPYKPD